MIPVVPQAEPHDFNAKVRIPGIKFLTKTPNPNAKEFKSNNFWKFSAKELYEAYSRTCAYSCQYIESFHNVTIDHFKSKSANPHLAYEWDNYRLSVHRLNLYKDNSADIIDPFIVQEGWFVLDFPSCLVKAGDGIDHGIRINVDRTIKILKLNDDDTLVQDRCDYMVLFANGEIKLSFLQKRRPFLALEIVRQGIQDNAAALFKKPN